MGEKLKLALAQLNPTVGDIAGNIGKLTAAWLDAAKKGADIVIAPELYVTGYPIEDFALNPDLQKTVYDSVRGLALETASGPALIVGAPWFDNGKLYNAALLLDGGIIKEAVYKRDLPNYGCFDEKRVFEAGRECRPLIWRGRSLGVMVCEDMWKPETSLSLQKQGAEVLIVLNGSPFEEKKQKQRFELARERTSETGLPLVYMNLVGGQDELVFEGSSFVMSASGEVLSQAASWEEDVLISNWETPFGSFKPELSNQKIICEGDEAVYQALMIGVRDYVRKNKFENVILGLSGGIDSALVAAIAVDALGAEKVRAFMMPSPYTSQESIDDAAEIARTLNIRLKTIPITEAMQVFEHILATPFAGCPPDITEENIQARCRGIILMALSNKGGSLVLATGNKSEMATGYATLYGDMCGGYAPLKDVYKTLVYRLARWRNANKPKNALGYSGTVINEKVMIKAPTAELRPNQKDQDSLPPYEILDGILQCIVEGNMGIAETMMCGYEANTVKRVMSMLDNAEYKRRQSPPGPKITKKHLSKERRYPITNRYLRKV